MKSRRKPAHRSLHSSRALPWALGVAASAMLSGGGCATSVNTLEPDGEPKTAGRSGAGTGGSAGGGGSKATGGVGSAGKGGTGSQAFGGASATGGTGGKGGSAGAGGNATGGSAGAGGGATAGSASGGSGGGGTASGGTGGGAGSGGTGVATGCLKDWQDNEACDTCTTQTQGDKLGCVDILDCYALNDCGPSTCANNDDKCGVNKIAKGTAGYEIAADVHACICK